MLMFLLRLELLCIRDLFSALCFSYLCWKPSCTSDILVCHGRLLCQRLCSNDSLTGRMHSLVKGIGRGFRTQETESQHEEDEDHGLKTWNRPSACPCVICWSGVGVNSIQCSVCTRKGSGCTSVGSGCTRSAVVSEDDWLRIQTMTIQDAVVRLNRLVIDLSHR